MPFVKLDCGMLDSTIWWDKLARDVFITALLMAEPIERTTSSPQIEVDAIKTTGWSAPPGWYGFVAAAGSGITRRAVVDEREGLEALRRLGSPDSESRTPDFEGRRMIRVDGGYLILNFHRFRERDYTGAERAARYRQRKKASERNSVTDGRNGVIVTPVTQAEAEAEAEVEKNRDTADSDAPFEAFWESYPRKAGKGDARKAWKSLKAVDRGLALAATKLLASAWKGNADLSFCPYPATWLRRDGWDDAIEQTTATRTEKTWGQRAAVANPDGRIRLGSGWTASPDGNAIWKGIVRYERRNGGEFGSRYVGRDDQGVEFYVTGEPIQYHHYGAAIRAKEQQILRGHPIFNTLFPETLAKEKS